MNRGDIYWVNLGDSDPPEFGKTRPAVVVSNSEQNHILDYVVVVPVSSRPGEIWPLRISLATHVSSPQLPRESFAVVAGLRQVAKSRLVGLAGRVAAHSLGRLKEAVHQYLSD